MVKNLPANAGDIRDKGLIPGSGRSHEKEMATLQCSCMEKAMDRGAWRATVHMVTNGRIWLKRLNMQARMKVYESYDLYVSQIKSVNTSGMWSTESGRESRRNSQQPVLSWPTKTIKSVAQLGSFSYKSQEIQLSLVETKKANSRDSSINSNVTENLHSHLWC